MACALAENMFNGLLVLGKLSRRLKVSLQTINASFMATEITVGTKAFQSHTLQEWLTRDQLQDLYHPRK